MKKLIYIYDAYCPWCYAFTSIVKQLYDTYYPCFEFEIISGGMMVGDQIKTFSGETDSNKLRMSYITISELSGAEFGDAFFERIREEEIVMNSEIPARALAVFREMKTSVPTIEFVHTLLQHLFFKGGNPLEDEFYQELADHFHLDSDLFIENMKKEYFQQQARYDFTLAKQLKAESFPRLYLQTSDTHFYLISKGYSEYQNIVEIINKIETDQ